jgi:mono/diheme cytochrome c family protein
MKLNRRTSIMAPVSRTSLRAAVVAGALAASSCTDPVLDQTVEDQGKETARIEKGEFHRAGQRCTACHQEGGEAGDAPFTLAGTVFAQPNRQVGVGAVEVRLTDSDGTKHTAKTNCVGNFFVKASEWTPKFPILVEIAKNGVRRSMRSPIGRETACAGCHTLASPPADPFSQLGHVYLYATDEPNAPNGDDKCPVDPVRPGTK